MKDKGFTIIELLAVIVILGLLMAIAIPSIINTQREILGKINTQQEKSLKEAGKTLGVDLDDTYSDIFNCSGWIKTELEEDKCDCDRDATTGECISSWRSIKVTVDQLKSHGYFDDKQSKCKKENEKAKGLVIIEKEDKGYNVILDGVSCGE